MLCARLCSKHFTRIHQQLVTTPPLHGRCLHYPHLQMRKLRLRAGRDSDRIQTNSGPRVCSVTPCSVLPSRPYPLTHLQMRPSFLLSQVKCRVALTPGRPQGDGRYSTSALPVPRSMSLPVGSTDTDMAASQAKMESGIPPPPAQLLLDSNLLLIPHSSRQLRPGISDTEVLPEPSPFSIPAAPVQASASTLTLPVHSSPERALETFLFLSVLAQLPFMAPHC